MPGKLFVVATPIGNLEDITARALRVLREAALIAAEDTRRTARLLAHYGITTPSTSLHEHNEATRSAQLIARLKGGDHVALVSDAGTPTISDPGRRLVQAALAEGVRVEPVPGPSAVVTALSISGFPSDTFLFLGFPPTRSKDRKKWFETLAEAGRTVVFFEAPHRIKSTLAEIREKIGECQVAVSRELTKIHEELVVRPISEVISGIQTPRGEYTVALNLVVSQNISPSNRPKGADLVNELGEMTVNRGLTRAQGLAELADKYGLSRNMVYAMIEKAKK